MPKKHGLAIRQSQALADLERRVCALRSQVRRPTDHESNRIMLNHAKVAMQADILREKLGKPTHGHRHLQFLTVDDSLFAGRGQLTADSVHQARELLKLATAVDELRLVFNVLGGTTEPLAHWLAERAQQPKPCTIGMIVLTSGNPSGREVLREILQHHYLVVAEESLEARLIFWSEKLDLPERRNLHHPEHRDWLRHCHKPGPSDAINEVVRLLAEFPD